MDRVHFDRVADEYRSLHARNIRSSGESPEFFAEYKVKDVAGSIPDAAVAALRILDFGVGVGNSLPYFRCYFPRSSVVGVDVSRRSLALAATRYPAMSALVTFDGDRLPFADASFDLAFTANVFHHIDHADHIKHFRDLLRVLRPGAPFFIFEHNPYNPLTMHAVSTCEFDADAHLIWPGKMRRRLTEAGFSDIKIRFRIFFPHALRGLRGLEKWLVSLPLGAQYYAVARRPLTAASI
jgi:SAM-dependent methyltransferase